MNTDTTTPADPTFAKEQQARDDAWARLTPKQKRGFVRQQLRRQERRQKREAFKAIQGVIQPGSTGYCCPKCHRWFTTTEERAACRASHRKESTTP